MATPDGRGVVAAVLAADLEFSQNGDEPVDVETNGDQPAYVDEYIDALDGFRKNGAETASSSPGRRSAALGEGCAEELADEVGDERARERCSAMKDELLGTKQ